MLLDGKKRTDSSNIVSTCDHNCSTVVELNNSINLFGHKVELDSITVTNVWMWEPDGSSIVSGNAWNLCLANLLSDNFAELE